MTMYKYFPHSEKDIKEMLEVIGVKKIDDIFGNIPQNILYQKEINIDYSL